MNTKHALAGAHPRSRGENVLSVDAEGPLAGSSPLTRGKRVDEQAANVRPGLIPAHAGKTSVMTMHGGASRAHPRSRGENWGGDACGVVAAGSSPLTRGKQSHIKPEARPVGLIPAHAGKTPSTGYPRRRTRAHPRSRGENGTAARPRYRARGSSPLTRGKQACGEARVRAGRLIPAHAGKTAIRPRGRGMGRAHPRSRGENLGCHFHASLVAGSSPLTRGKHSSARGT